MKAENPFNKGNEEKKEAKFNAGLAKLERVHGIRQACHGARINKDWDLLWNLLVSLRTELNYKMDEDTLKEANKKEADIKTQMKGKEIRNPYFNNSTIRRIDYRPLLFDYELWLCDLMENYGMGMPDKASAGEAANQ